MNYIAGVWVAAVTDAVVWNTPNNAVEVYFCYLKLYSKYKYEKPIFSILKTIKD